MYDLKKIRVVILLVFAACGFYKGKAMKKYGLTQRHAQSTKSAPEGVPLLKPTAIAPVFLRLCHPRNVLGSEDASRQGRDLFVSECLRNAKVNGVEPVFCIRPVVVEFFNASGVNLRQESVGYSSGCTVEMAPLIVHSGQTRHIVVNAPSFFAGGTTFFMTLTFPFEGTQLRRVIIGVTLDQSFPFKDHTARILVRVLNERNVVEVFGDCKEGKGGPGQIYFQAVRDGATSPGSVSELGNFGIVAAVDQSRAWSSVASFTFVRVVFTDRASLECQLGVGQRHDDAAQTESAPPSRITSEGSGNE
jgi:hypothetical protein